MIELVVVVAILSLFLMIAVFNIAGLFANTGFDGRAFELVNLMRRAASNAAQSGTRFEVRLDFDQGIYLVRRISTDLAADVLEDEIIDVGYFDDKFILDYVMFDDFESTHEGLALFRVGKNGWQYGGKIVLLNDRGEPYSIVVNRISRNVEFKSGDVEILTPKLRDEIVF